MVINDQSCGFIHIKGHSDCNTTPNVPKAAIYNIEGQMIYHHIIF